jgi:hypothetical protein
MGCIMDLAKFKTRDNGHEAPTPQEHQHAANDAADIEGGTELESQILENVGFRWCVLGN